MQHSGKSAKFTLLTAVFLTLALFPLAPAHAAEWVQIGLAGSPVGKVAVDPDNPARIFALSNTTVYRSTDSGQTFEPVYVNPRGFNFNDVKISSVSADFIVVADAGNALGENAHVHYSINGGTDWNEFDFSYNTVQEIGLDPLVAADFYVTTAFQLYKRDTLIEPNGGQDFAVCPSNNQLLFLGAGDTLGVGISTDGGSSWQYYNEGLPVHSTTRVNDIAVNPDDCTKIAVLVQTGANPSTYHGFFSDDGGFTYEDIAWNFGSSSDALIDPTVGASGTVFACSGQGVFRYPIDLAAWDDFSAGLEGAATDVNGLANLPGEVLYAGTGDGIWKFDYLPSLMVATRRFDDSSGNANGRPEEGEQIAVSLYLYNSMFQAEGVTGTIATTNSNVTIDDADASFPTIPALAALSNGADPFLVTVNAGAPHAEKVAFDLLLTSNEGGYNDTLTFEMFLARNVILIVDDDEGGNYENYYTASLDTLDMTDSIPNSYDRWDVNLYGPVNELIQEPWFHAPIIWFTGDADTVTHTLTADDQATVTAFLDAGKDVFLTGKNIAEDLAGSDFLTSTLGIDWVQNLSDAILNGVRGDPVGDRLPAVLTQGAMGANNQGSTRDELAIALSDIVSPCIMYDTTAATIAGVRIEKGAGRCVFLGFGFEAVNNSNTPSFATRKYMMQVILEWLRVPTAIGDSPGEPAGTLPRVMALEQNYPNPFNPQTSISFTVPGTEGQAEPVRLAVYSMRGRLVRMLLDKEIESGRHVVVWDGHDESGREVSSGIYLYRLESGDDVAVRKMVVLK
jgi:hypothetical protein